MTTHEYTDGFFDYIDAGARASARRVIALVTPWVSPESILDLGSGRGVWLEEWMKSGISDVLGIDGDYVNRDKLAIPVESFRAADLTKPQILNRNFDLAQSLEVGEHLPEASSKALVESLTRHSNCILFSAAVPGQGGEFHINEKPLEYWRQLFQEQGFNPFDCIRPAVSHLTDVEPWYRYNTILYLNAEGLKKAPQEVLATRIPDDRIVPLGGSLSWKLRKAIVSRLPQTVVTNIALGKAAIVRKSNARRAVTAPD